MLIDLHTHTFPKSLCSVLRPADLIERAKDCGLDGICPTEHNQVWTAPEVADLADGCNLLVLRGIEVATNVGHVLVFGLDDFTVAMPDIRRLRQIVDAAGGVTIAAHPMRDLYFSVP